MSSGGFARLIYACYPRPVRDRWGGDLIRELELPSSRRLNAAAGAADLWLHPAIWPTDQERRRRALAGYAVAVLAFACLIERGLDRAPLSELGFEANFLAVMTGLLAAIGLVPVPSWHPRDLWDLCRLLSRKLCLPTVAFALLVVLAHMPSVAGWLKDPVVGDPVWAAYWMTLIGGCVQLVRAYIEVNSAGLVRPVGHRRVRLALVVSGVASALSVIGVLDMKTGFGSIVCALGMATLAGLCAQNALTERGSRGVDRSPE